MSDEEAGCTAADPTAEPPKKPKEPEFSTELDLFIEYIRSMKTTMPLVMTVLTNEVKTAAADLQKLLEAKGKNVERLDEHIIRAEIDPDLISEVVQIIKRVNAQNLSRSFMPRSFIVSLVSQYEAYLGDIIKVMFHKCPQLLSTSQKSLTFSQLAEFSSMEEAQNFILEKEIESVLRDSHDEQIKWLERLANVPLKKGLDIWPRFIELTERRNLFVHSGGHVSRQYCKVCRDHGVELETDLAIGDELNVTAEYFQDSCDCILELGVKLAHVIWRKLVPTEREKADGNLSSICYELLREGEYALALELLTFATETIKKHFSELDRLVFIVNRAQALKWLDKNDECQELLSTVDWSPTQYKFHLAKFVLEDAYASAARMMERIGPDGDIRQQDYKEWPLFKEFRKTDEFRTAYKKIFGESPFSADITEQKGVLPHE